MKTIYFQLVGGAAGDMLLMSLIELGLPLKVLKKELKKLNINFDIKINIDNTRGHVAQKHLEFSGPNLKTYNNIVKVIKASKLLVDIKQKVLQTFKLIADVERKVHKSKGLVHFHHLAEIDAILEVCGFFIGLKYLKVDNCLVSAYPIAKPAPATIELLAGKDVYFTKFNFETVTPTAAALLSPYQQSCGWLKYTKAAISFGEKAYPDYLVAYLSKADFLADQVIKIEVNIDEMSPMSYEPMQKALFSQGAKDVYLQQVLMKKNRPGVVVNVLCLSQDFDKIRDAIFKHTTTFGLRYQEYCRDKLPYEFVYKKTALGKVKYRVSKHPQIKKAMPEYEDVKLLSEKLNLPFNDIYKHLT